MTSIKNSGPTKQTDIIARLRKDVDNLIQAAKVNQLNYSALHDTALPIYGVDNDGIAELRSRIGKQPDGNYSIKYMNGDPPPIPTGIGIAERQLGILITWDGTFTGNTERTSNFSRLDVYIDDTSGFTRSVDNLMGSMFTESALFIGADVTIKYVQVVAVNTSDVPSSATVEVSVTPLPAGELAAESVNAINLAAEIILTSIIQSSDYDSGVSGWYIDGDGTAEFNNLIARGDIEAKQVKTPSNAQFIPGTRSTGIVSDDIPPELAALGYTAGLVFHNVDWNPASTTRQVKFRFIVATAGGLGIGYGMVTNPSVSQTAVIIFGTNIVNNLAERNIFGVMGQTNNPIVEITSQGITVGGVTSYWPVTYFRAPDGEYCMNLSVLDTFEALNFDSGTGLARIVHYRNENRLQIPEHFVRDLTWKTFSYNNSWFDSVGARYRYMPDGTVLLRGEIRKNAAPTNGQTVFTLPSGYRPDAACAFPTATPGTLHNGQQWLRIESTGVCQIWDPVGGNGVMALDGIRFPYMTLAM